MNIKADHKMSGSWAIELSEDCTLHPTHMSRKAREKEIKDIVTAVNNFEKMKEALEKLVMAAEYSRYHSMSSTLRPSIKTAKQLLESIK